MDVITAIESRRSNRHYDPARPVDRATIEELLRLASLSPSSFNLQHWKVIVVHDDPERKALLHELAMGQPQVLAAAATLILVADPTVYQNARAHFGEWVTAGVLTEELADKYTALALDSYDPPTGQSARDEALRSVGLWATTFMLAAQAKGLATCPMIGFDPVGVRKAFHIPEPMFPAMLITLGYEKGEPRPRLSRRPASEFVHWNDW